MIDQFCNWTFIDQFRDIILAEKLKGILWYFNGQKAFKAESRSKVKRVSSHFLTVVSRK